MLSENVQGTSASFAAQPDSMWQNIHLQSKEVLSFAEFRGRTFEDLLKEPPGPPEKERLLSTLLEVVRLTRSTMDHMNEVGPGLPTDSADHILDLLTRKSARTVVLTGREREGGEPKVLGYGLIILEREDIPDLEEIPDALKEGQDIARAIRLFVRPEAALYGAEDSSTSAILDTLEALAAGKRIVGKVLVGPDTLDPLWFRAPNALRNRGYEDSGYAAAEKVPGPDGERELLFKWWVFPPDGELAIRRREEYNQKFGAIKVERRQRIAAPVAHFAVNGERYGCLCKEDDVHLIGELCPGSFFYDICNEKERKRRGKVRLANIIPKEPSPFEPVVPGQELGGFWVSNVLPDILPAEREAAKAKLKELLQCQMAQMKPGGRLVLRDTIAPADNGPIECRFSATSREKDGESVAALFEQFLKLQPEARRRQVSTLESPNDNMRSYRGPADLFAHFALIKEYHKDFKREARRNICCLTQTDIEEVARDCGLKIVSSKAEFNEWIRTNWFEGLLSFHDRDGNKIPYPATSYCLVAQKVDEEAAVTLTPPEEIQEVTPSFLSLETMRGEDGKLVQLALHPHQTLDLVPFFIYEDCVYVIPKRDYPRPVICAGDPALDDAKYGGFLDEQITQIITEPLLINGVLAMPSLETTARLLRERGGIWPEAIKGGPVLCRAVLAAPHLVDEIVVSGAIPVCPLPGLLHPAQSYSRLSSKGVIAPMDAREVLYACQNGDLPNARLECKVYEILQMLRKSRGPWIGGVPGLSQQTGAAFLSSRARDVLKPPSRTFFRPAEDSGEGFLGVWGGPFSENLRNGKSMQAYFEFVRPRKGFSTNSAAVLPVLRTGPCLDDIYVGIELRDLAAAQNRLGSSLQASLPLFKVPTWIRNLDALRGFLQLRTRTDFSLIAKQLFALGGKYFSSPGITPELVYPYIMEVDLKSARLSSLAWVSLRDLLENQGLIVDLNLLIAVLRAAHMFGIKPSR